MSNLDRALIECKAERDTLQAEVERLRQDDAGDARLSLSLVAEQRDHHRETLKLLWSWHKTRDNQTNALLRDREKWLEGLSS